MNPELLLIIILLFLAILPVCCYWSYSYGKCVGVESLLTKQRIMDYMKKK